MTLGRLRADGRARRSSPLPKKGRPWSPRCRGLSPTSRRSLGPSSTSSSKERELFMQHSRRTCDVEKKSSSRHPRGLSDGGVDAPDVAGRVLFAFRLHTAPIAHSAPHCRLRILKGGRESFECTCVLVFMRTRPLVHVSSIFGPGSGRPKSWYDRGLIRFIILTLSARYSPGILAFLSDSGGNKCPSWRWHCRQGHH